MDFPASNRSPIDTVCEIGFTTLAPYFPVDLVHVVYRRNCCVLQNLLPYVHCRITSPTRCSLQSAGTAASGGHTRLSGLPYTCKISSATCKPHFRQWAMFCTQCCDVSTCCLIFDTIVQSCFHILRRRFKYFLRACAVSFMTRVP
jgi:hypothetical protein